MHHCQTAGPGKTLHSYGKLQTPQILPCPPTESSQYLVGILLFEFIFIAALRLKKVMCRPVDFRFLYLKYIGRKNDLKTRKSEVRWKTNLAKLGIRHRSFDCWGKWKAL